MERLLFLRIFNLVAWIQILKIQDSEKCYYFAIKHQIVPVFPILDYDVYETIALWEWSNFR